MVYLLSKAIRYLCFTTIYIFKDEQHILKSCISILGHLNRLNAKINTKSCTSVSFLIFS